MVREISNWSLLGLLCLALLSACNSQGNKYTATDTTESDGACHEEAKGQNVGNKFMGVSKSANEIGQELDEELGISSSVKIRQRIGSRHLNITVQVPKSTFENDQLRQKILETTLRDFEVEVGRYAAGEFYILEGEDKSSQIGGITFWFRTGPVRTYSFSLPASPGCSDGFGPVGQPKPS